MKQSAVEFLLEKFKSQNTLLFADDWEQAKEMEKQQIIESFKNGDRNNDIECLNAYCNGTFETINAEQYYKETFNK